MVMASWASVESVTPNSWRKTGAPGTHMVGAMLVTRAKRDTMMMCAHFLPPLQLCGFSGSCGPSQSTMLVSCASCLVVGMDFTASTEVGDI